MAKKKRKGLLPGNPNPSIATRFKPGQSGNPKGRPKGKVSFKFVLREILDSIAETGHLDESDRHRGFIETVRAQRGDEFTYKFLIALRHILKASEGDLGSAQFVADRTEGKPIQHNKNENAEVTLEQLILGEVPGGDEDE